MCLIVRNSDNFVCQYIFWAESLLLRTTAQWNVVEYCIIFVLSLDVY